MPFVCTGPVSRKVGDTAIKLKRGDHVSDELGADILKTHPHALTRVPHTSHNCTDSCTHHTHPWNQPAPAKAEPVRASRRAAAESATSEVSS